MSETVELSIADRESKLIDEIRANAIKEALIKHNGSLTKAAKELSIDRKTLYNRIRALKITIDLRKYVPREELDKSTAALTEVVGLIRILHAALEDRTETHVEGNELFDQVESFLNKHK